MATTAGLGITLMEAKQTQPHIVVNEIAFFLDRALAGRLSKDMTGLTTYVLTNQESIYTLLNPWGAPTADFTFIINGTQKLYLVINDSNKTCSIGAATGVKVAVLAGQTVLAYFDGTNMHEVTDLDTGWLIVTPGTGWSNSGGAWSILANRKTGKKVSLKGNINSAAATTTRTIMTLPVGMRPAADLTFASCAGNVMERVVIYASGVVEYAGANASLTNLSLDGIGFVI